MKNINDLPNDSLQESEEWYRSIIESHQDAFCVTDLKGQILEVNDAYCKLHSFTRQELLTKSILDFESLESPAENAAHIQRVIDKGEDFFVTKHRVRNGEFIDLEVKINYHPGGNGRLVAFLHDITKRKKAENELLKLSRAVNQSSASVVITNREGNIEFVNQTLCDLTGYSKEELIGKNPRIWKSGAHDGEFYKKFWDTLLSGNNTSGEILNKKKNGELYWESALISPLINEKAEITHFVAVKEDITEKKKMISALIEAKEMAESANKLKDAFIANISHEIRTPLNGVLGMTNLIKEAFEGTLKDEDEVLFEGLEISSKRIIRTVDMILNYSRLQVGEFRMNPVKINVSQICTDLVKQFNSAAKLKSLDLILQVKCSDSTIVADDNSITIAISNLIDNAIKYTFEGSVCVILRNGINNDLILEVKDTGIGISENYLDHVFEPYRQEHMGYGRAYDGIGLGLAMVKKLFDLNNALMKVESKKGAGTTFSINFGKVVLPADILPVDSIENIINPLKEQQKMSVLLVEDDFLNQFTIKRFIDKKHVAIVADSSNRALEILNNQKVDLILMDVSIKGSKNGLDLTRELKASKEFSHIPVIAITAHAFESDKQNALDAGCDSFLPKPFSRESLLRAIDELNIK